MGFEVTFRSRDVLARARRRHRADGDGRERFNTSDEFRVDGGALFIKRGDGTASIYSSSVWESIDIDSSDELPPHLFDL